MNKLSTLPVGYKPTNTDQIRTYCHGNNGYFVKNSATIVNYDWRTDDGVLYEKHDGTNCGSRSTTPTSFLTRWVRGG